MGQRMGADGIDLHFNWFGFLHWFGPNGTPALLSSNCAIEEAAW
jgi:hypothetical protein